MLKCRTQAEVKRASRRERQEEEAGGKRETRTSLMRTVPRSVIGLNTRRRCARIGLSLMGNSVAMATSVNLLMGITRCTCLLHPFTLSISPRIALSFTIKCRSHAHMEFDVNLCTRKDLLKKFINFTMFTSSMR